MTDPRAVAVEVLAEALRLLDHGPDGAEYSHTYTVDSPESFAAAIIDASPRLASLLLTGAALEMLPVVFRQMLDVGTDDDGYGEEPILAWQPDLASLGVDLRLHDRRRKP